jgi:hypothetical protein
MRPAQKGTVTTLIATPERMIPDFMKLIGAISDTIPHRRGGILCSRAAHSWITTRQFLILGAPTSRYLSA